MVIDYHTSNAMTHHDAPKDASEQLPLKVLECYHELHTYSDHFLNECTGNLPRLLTNAMSAFQ